MIIKLKMCTTGQISVEMSVPEIETSNACTGIYIYIYIYIYVYIYIYIYIYCTEEATEMAAKYLLNKKMCF